MAVRRPEKAAPTFRWADLLIVLADDLGGRSCMVREATSGSSITEWDEWSVVEGRVLELGGSDREAREDKQRALAKSGQVLDLRQHRCTAKLNR